METLKTINYSEKAIVVFGQTKEYKEQLKQLGGRFNPYLTINGTKQAGWVFSKQKTELINNFLETIKDKTMNEICKPCNFELPTKVQTERTFNDLESELLHYKNLLLNIEQPLYKHYNKKNIEQIINELESKIKIVTPVIASPEPIVTPEPEPVIQQVETKQTERIETPKIKQVIKQAVSKFKVNFKSIFAQFKSNNSLPILDNVKVESNGTAILSDLETNVILPNYFSNKSDGTICLPLEQIKNIKDANLLYLDIHKTECSAKLGQFKLAGMNANDFPKVCDKVFKHIGTLDKNGIDIAKIAVDYTGKDELRPIYSSVHFDKTNGNIVSTDAHKLYYKQAHNLTESFNLNVKTAKLLGLLSDTYEVFISECMEYIKFESVNGTIISRLIDGKYPQYMAVIPTNNDKVFTVDKAKLIKVVNEALKCANKTTKQVIFKFGMNNLIVNAEELDFGLEYSCEIQAESNEVFDIGFNGKFLLGILANISEANVAFECSESNRASLINKDFLLMPVIIK